MEPRRVRGEHPPHICTHTAAVPRWITPHPRRLGRQQETAMEDEEEEEEEAASRRPHAPTATSLPARPASPPRGRPCGDRGAGGAGQRSPAGGSGEVSRHPAACGERTAVTSGAACGEGGSGSAVRRRRRRKGGCPKEQAGWGRGPSPASLSPGHRGGEEAGAPPLSHASPVQRLQGGEGEAAAEGEEGGEILQCSAGRAGEGSRKPSTGARRKPPGRAHRLQPPRRPQPRGTWSGRGGTDATTAGDTAGRPGRKGRGERAPTFHHPVRRR